MRPRRLTTFIFAAYVLIDIAVILFSFYLALLIRQKIVAFDISIDGFLSSSNPFKFLFVLWSPIIIVFHMTHGLYQTHREQWESMEVAQVIKSVAWSVLVIITLAYLFKIQDFPRSIMILSALLIIVLCSLWRIIKKALVSYLVKRGYNNFRTLIIGAGKVGTLLADEIKKRPELGINIVGFLDDFKTGTCGNGRWPIIGRIQDYESIVQREFIDKIFISIYHNRDGFVQLLEESRRRGISVRVVPQGFEWMGQDPARYNIGIIPILSYSDGEVNYHMRAKRFFDIVLALLLLVLSLPLLMVIGVLIKLDSPGPILYKSRRYGRKGEIFPMYKFRSMVSNADELLQDLKSRNEVDGPIFKIRKDPRITPFGAFLRKYSLDELPQIINVIKGDMSLVGPRPLPIDQIEKEDLQQLKRLEVRPGITGLWQIRGRSDVSFVRLVKWDIWYINNWSFGLDLFILFQTIPVVLRGRGAY